MGTSFTQKLPEELHDMLEAGLSNAIYRVITNDSIMPMRGLGYDRDSEDEIDSVVDVFMEELAKPIPQMEPFIRHHRLRKDICEYDMPTRMEILSRHYERWISVKLAHRIFEQEIYDFGRSLGLSKEQATGHVVKAREASGKYNVDLMKLGDYESRECTDILDYLMNHPKPERKPFGGKIEGLMYLSESEIGEIEQLLAKSNSKVAKQVEYYLQTLKDNDLRSEYETIILRLRFHEDEPLIDNISGLREKIENLEAADKTKEESIAGKNAKKARKAELRAQRKASRQVEKRKSQTSDDHQAERPKKQKLVASNPERPAQVQPIEDQEKALKWKKKGRKLKSEPQLPIQSEAPSEERDQHRKGRVGMDTQDPISKKGKKKRDMGPQHSPFFQRSSNPKVKKHAVKKAEQLLDFQVPMIQ